MKVMLAHKFHYVTGGAEVFYFEVARVLESRGHEVAFFSTENEANSKSQRSYFVEEPKYKSTNIIAKVKGLAGMFYSGEKKQKMIEAINDLSLIHI